MKTKMRKLEKELSKLISTFINDTGFVPMIEVKYLTGNNVNVETKALEEGLE